MPSFKRFFSKISLWRWSLALTFPIALGFSIWAAKTYHIYKGVRYEYCSTLMNSDKALYQAGQVSFFEIFRDIHSAFFVQRVPADVNLYISQSGLNKLNKDIPYSGRDYQKGLIAYDDGTMGKVKMRYRGDCSYHWLFKEKSYKIKTTKKKLWRGRRTWNLIIPKSDSLIMNHYNYKFAKLIGVLAPHSELVTVNINGKHEGLRVLVEQLDESFLRRNQLMPNDLYFGDNFFKGKYWGIEANLFSTPIAWEKKATNNHHPDGFREPINILIKALKNKNTSLLDYPAFAKFSVFIDLSKATHISSINNWRLYYDSYRERFFPIVWDAGGWNFEKYNESKDKTQIITTEIMALLHSDPKFIEEKHKFIRKFYSGLHREAEILLQKEVLNAHKKIIHSPFIYYTNTYHKVVNKQTQREAVNAYANRVLESFKNYKEQMKLNPISITEERKEVVWDKNKEFPESVDISDDIKILPGIKVRIGPGQVVRFRGKLTVNGTRDFPVRFLPLEDGKPFGSVVLKDSKANGSTLRNCIFTNGSGSKGPLHEYIGMLSIHNVQKVNVESCLFNRSYLTDDMIHIVYSEVNFYNSRFVSANSDAIDADISTITIDHSRFENAGNDSLDLMDSTATVRNSLFENSKDKGISVGEGSDLFAYNNRFNNNSIGVEVKDGSIAQMSNLEFHNNSQAINTYRKNWQYATGGETNVQNSVFKNNDSILSAGKSSKISLVDSYVDTPIKPHKRISLKWVDDHEYKINDTRGDSPASWAPRMPASQEHRKYIRKDVRGNF